MKAFDSGPGWVLYHARAEDFLASHAIADFDVVTDPPYTEVPRNTARKVEHTATDAVKEVVGQLIHGARSAVIITGSTITTRTVLCCEPRRILAIHQGMGTAVPKDTWMYGLQLANVYGPPLPLSGMSSRPYFQLGPRSVARQPRPPDHPNALPPALGSWLAQGLAGRMVLDPFCGGGGLIAGARAVGASTVVGVDVSAEWLEFARAKLIEAPERLWPKLRRHRTSEAMFE